MRIGHPHHRAVVHLVGERTVLEHVDDPTDLLLGVVLDVAHVGVHDIQAEMRDHLVQLPRALLVGGDLRAKVGEVLLDVAGGIASGGEEVAQLGLAEAALLNQQLIIDQHAFFVDATAVRRHRSRRDAADIGVVAARADEKEYVAARFVENRRDHGNVGQVRAAVVGRVEHVDIARPHRAGPLADDRLDALAHRAQVHRQVRRIRHQAAMAIEDGAGEVKPLLDVDRLRGIGQRRPHLLGDRHEQVVEDLQHHRIDVGADRSGRPDAAGHG